MSVEATILVEFNGGTPDDSEYIAIAELDDVENDGVTTFLPGAQPYIRGHFSNNVRVDAVVATDGGIVSEGADTRTLESTHLFTSRDTDSPSEFRLPVVPLSSSASYDGRQGGYSADIQNGGMVELTGDVGKTPFFMHMVNTYAIDLYRLIPPSLSLGVDETYTIYVVFYLTLLEG